MLDFPSFLRRRVNNKLLLLVAKMEMSKCIFSSLALPKSNIYLRVLVSFGHDLKLSVFGNISEWAINLWSNAKAKERNVCTMNSIYVRLFAFLSIQTTIILTLSTHNCRMHSKLGSSRMAKFQALKENQSDFDHFLRFHGNKQSWKIQPNTNHCVTSFVFSRNMYL